MRWEDPSPGRVVRGFVAGATGVFGVAALVSGEPKAWAACGAFGLMWAGWDFLGGYVFGPVSDWIAPVQARDVIARARRLFPDPEELRHYQ